MRGKDRENARHNQCERITPAHAGKRNKPGYYLVNATDHPRACGEKRGSRCRRRTSTGSPPRMRGKAFPHFTFRHNVWITPAHAGKSYMLIYFYGGQKDHPRACGEKGAGKISLRRAQGSPPRMRGKVFLLLFTFQSPGITPAHAGKSISGNPARCFQEDHPRACGEKMCR